ncbi:MAG: GTP cyclohydrolase [Methylotenera sp.]|nr:MAG: GTP cyclohydrolase [Methylotenera sp.]
MNNLNFFWRGPFSQWYPSTFTVNGKIFNCAEQYMMYSKAVFFGDHETAYDIMKSTNPKEQKSLGRRVEGFNAEAWNAVAQDFVYIGNEAKFSQNKKLYDVLMNTGTKTLVEASPYDAIWGIGLDEVAAKETPMDKWPGTNWLGVVLTEVKNHFIKNPIVWK